MSDQNTNPQSLPEHDEKTGSFAPRTAGSAYYEQEKAKKSKKSPLLAVGLALLLSAAGGFFGWTKYQTHLQTTVSLVTSELVESVLDLAEAEEEHGHAAALEPDVETRDRAQASIARLKKAQGRLVALSQKLPPAPLMQGAVESSQKSILAFAEANPEKSMQASQLGLYKGILTRCYIGGHDVHWINENGSIIDHVTLDQVLNPNDETARAVINSATGLEQTVVVVVYEKGYEIFDHQGRRLEAIEK
jgi:hypothetical protein